MKVDALDRIVAAVKSSVDLTVVTRWRVEELAIGVSDIDVWTRVRDRPQSTLWLLHSLHAKCYIADRAVLVGSANLTGAGLGWSQRPNVEVLESVGYSSGSVAHLRGEIARRALQVDDGVYQMTRRAIDEFSWERMEAVPTAVCEAAPELWSAKRAMPPLPQCRTPEYLYEIYTGRTEMVSRSSIAAGIGDLVLLDVPASLSESQFRVLIRSRLIGLPDVDAVRRFCTTWRRFGAVRDFLKFRLQGYPRCAAGSQWQVLMRWLREYAPDSVEFATPRHSELVRWRADVDCEAE